jgi:hypothetical protein
MQLSDSMPLVGSLTAYLTSGLVPYFYSTLVICLFGIV